MKIYVASKFERQQELKGYAQELRAVGHVVTARWLVEETEEDANHPNSVWLKNGWSNDPAQLAKFAQTDIDDIKDADALMVFTHDGMARGGMHVEFGLAIALNKMLIVVGPRPTLFHFLPQVRHFETWPEARAFLSEGW
jgi:hypothetical protein